MSTQHQSAANHQTKSTGGLKAQQCTVYEVTDNSSGWLQFTTDHMSELRSKLDKQRLPLRQ